MKNSKVIILLISLCGILLNCNQPVIGGLSSKNITGKEALEKLVQAGTQIDIIYLRSTTSSSSSPSTTSSFNTFAISSLATLLNGALIPIAAGLEDDKYYLKDGVDQCVTQIYALGLILDNFITVGLSCDIKPTPFLTIP